MPETKNEIHTSEAVEPKTESRPLEDHTEWRCRFPNPADFNFNYWRLLSKARGTAIAEPPANADTLRIAVVGAGVAGLTAARELLRCGYQNIDIYEATKRVGGRTYSIPSPDGLTTFEMGAMRMPFFWPHDEDGKRKGKGPGSQNCVLDYYCGEFNLLPQDFPNPGTEFSTGIYINRGRGVRPKWEEHECPPELIEFNDPNLVQIKQKWASFTTLFQGTCRKEYAKWDEWPEFWRAVVNLYDEMNFREFVRLPSQVRYDPGKPGYFGGLGMDADEARVFAVVGMGDGGWGAFYDISSLYVLRTALFGFFDDLQLIQGKFSEDGSPIFFDEAPQDSLYQPLARPAFLGVQSLAECLFYERATAYDKRTISLYDAMKETRSAGDRKRGVHLFTRSCVQQLKKLEEERGGGIHLLSEKVNDVYDHVVVTAQPWAMQVESAFDRFEYQNQLPWEVRYAMDLSHFITSCKVFYPLKERYWEKPHKLPQVIITDTFIQGVYGMAVKVRGKDQGHPGVALISYTWEDDAAKLVADDDATLARRCLDHLDLILTRCGKEPLSPYVNVGAPRVHHWVRSVSYRGCARLYRQQSQANDIKLLTYNEECSMHSGLYLAGEAYSVEGGWVEPALRSALHAVLYLVKNTGGNFKNGFNFNNYPRYR